jgi:guanyl-specific ribonuclease Sa
VAHPNSPAGKYAEPSRLSLEYLRQLAREAVDGLAHSAAVSEVLRFGRKILGGASFGVGVVVGLDEAAGQMVEGNLKGAVRAAKLAAQASTALAGLAKTFIYADIYDAEHAPVNSPFRLGRYQLWLVRSLITEVDLKKEHDRRDAILKEMAYFVHHAPEILAKAGAKMGAAARQMFAGLEKKWKQFQGLYQQGGVASMYRAGEIFGQLLFDALMVLVAAGTAIAAIVGLPELVAAAGAVEAAEAAGAAEAAEAAEAGEAAAEAAEAAETAEEAEAAEAGEEAGATKSASSVPDDLQNTLDRIDRGESFPHRNDGSIFRNREGRLPSQPEGYYKEYVHPTPGVNGPGAQRVIIGQGGEVYYTPDHYGTFVRVK